MDGHIKELLLITFANKVYRDKLESKGFRVIEYAQPLIDESISEIGKAAFKGIALIEIIEDTMERLGKMITGLRENSARIIAVTAKINNNFRNFFFRHGIPEVLESHNADRIADYIDLTERNGNKKYGKLLILDDDMQRRNIFETIIGRFNYSAVIIESADKLFENLTAINIQLLLVNLGAKNFDLNYFLRRSLSSEIIRKIPVIPYKDAAQGIFIHEMTSGLNKIAKIILTTDEVYSFLVDILFRKELSPGIKLLNETLDLDNLNKFTGEPLSRIYNIMGANIFTMKKIITKDNINIIDGRIESLKNLVIKVDGLKWLIKDDINNNFTIGGV